MTRFHFPAQGVTAALAFRLSKRVRICGGLDLEMPTGRWR